MRHLARDDFSLLAKCSREQKYLVAFSSAA
jgi:hypothetical protein